MSQKEYALWSPASATLVSVTMAKSPASPTSNFLICKMGIKVPLLQGSQGTTLIKHFA